LQKETWRKTERRNKVFERLTTSTLDKAGHARDGSELRGFSAANTGIFGENALLALQSHSRAIQLHGFWIEKGDSGFNDWRHDGFFEAREFRGPGAEWISRASVESG
jgi:hypothetical protein